MKTLISVLMGVTLMMNPVMNFETVNLKIQAQSYEMNNGEYSTEDSTMFIQLEDPDEIDDGATEIVDENKGNVVPYSIIGPDNRTQVTDINAFPNRQVVQVESTFKVNDDVYKSFIGTGCLVGKDTVLNEKEVAALTKFGWKFKGESWYEPADGDRVVFRLRNPNKETFNHHLTTNEREKDYLVSIGWIDEGIAWKAY